MLLSGLSKGGERSQRCSISLFADGVRMIQYANKVQREGERECESETSGGRKEGREEGDGIKAAL